MTNGKLLNKTLATSCTMSNQQGIKESTRREHTNWQAKTNVQPCAIVHTKANMNRKFQKLNARRLDSIQKKYATRLTKEEEAELEDVTTKASDIMNKYQHEDMDKLEQIERHLRLSGNKLSKELDKMGIYTEKKYDNHVNRNIVFKCLYGNQHNLLIWFSPTSKKLEAEAVDLKTLAKYSKANVFKRFILGLKYIFTGNIGMCDCHNVWECTDLDSLKELQWAAEQVIDLKQLSTMKKTKRTKRI